MKDSASFSRKMPADIDKSIRNDDIRKESSTSITIRISMYLEILKKRSGNRSTAEKLWRLVKEIFE
jgi:hypothetical protein